MSSLNSAIRRRVDVFPAPFGPTSRKTVCGDFFSEVEEEALQQEEEAFLITWPRVGDDGFVEHSSSIEALLFIPKQISNEYKEYPR